MGDTTDKYHNNCNRCNDIVETIIECVQLSNVSNSNKNNNSNKIVEDHLSLVMIDECAATSTLQMSSSPNHDKTSTSDSELYKEQKHNKVQQQSRADPPVSVESMMDLADNTQNSSTKPSSDAQSLSTTMIVDCMISGKRGDDEEGGGGGEISSSGKRSKKTSSVSAQMAAKDSFICRICHNNNQVERYEDHSFFGFFSFYVFLFNYGIINGLIPTTKQPRNQPPFLFDKINEYCGY